MIRQLRVGVATGIVTIGDCGAPPDLRDYTVIGDAANLAARLESANKQFDTTILVNGRCKDSISDDLLTRPLGKITVVGQQTPADVHELLAVRGEESEAQRSLVELAEHAVRLYESRDFDAAEEAWGRLDRAHGPSRLAQLYLDSIRRGRAHPDAFDGVLHLDRK